MSDFQSGLTADQAHARLRDSLQALQHAEKNAVLWFDEIRRRRLYRQLGYSSIHAYAAERLGFSKSRCSQFIRLTESLEKLPKLRGSVARGELAWTKVREVVKVASPANEARWIAEAKSCGRRQLEAKVKVCRERAQSAGRRDPAQASLLNAAGSHLTCEAPVGVSLRFTPEQFARYEALVEQLRKRRLAAGLPMGNLSPGREELMLAGLASLMDSISMTHEDAGHAPIQEGEDAAQDPVHENPGTGSQIKTRTREFTRVNSGSPFQIVIHKCKDCGKASIVSSRGDLVLSPATMSRAECDSRMLRPGERNKASIPPGLRRRVLARDGHRCRAPGCGSTRFLEVHHVRPRSSGGGNEPENLVTLCAGCHQLLHEMGSRTEVSFQRKGPVAQDPI